MDPMAILLVAGALVLLGGIVFAILSPDLPLDDPSADADEPQADANTTREPRRKHAR
jgi:hypothetical protein